ncbi:hypothetical protein NS115_24335 [Paenibacillus jamilae]|uniref:Uncharacterized protein n=1 Tax=Paenibacillus jamilae TaxID=114136 RepID=A0ACC4ZNJ3_9BACL|nr:hypothetical protein C0638_22050 [Paenibacillus sp. lzh-N1]KTS73288.1 hypothetical protein NS115_24335 [Paenibacillus jamilae]
MSNSRWENDILKQAALIVGTKVKIIKQNSDKYSVSALCEVLKSLEAPSTMKRKKKTTKTK